MAFYARITIKKNSDEGCSLYLNSLVTGKWHDSERGTLLRAEGTGIAFYSYSSYRRAYIFREASKSDDIFPLLSGKLPLVKGYVRIVYFAEGRRIDVLKFICHNIEKKYGKDCYLLPISYWLKISALADKFGYKNPKPQRTLRAVTLLTEKYKKRMEESE